MSKQEEKMMYRIIAQKEGITITAETSRDMTFDEAKETALTEVLISTDKEVKFQPYVVLPITSEERWNDKTINFCPRCGANIEDHGHEQYAMFDCFSCDTSMEVTIHTYDED